MTDQTSQPNKPLVLGSTSPYRAALLSRLGIAFEQRAPRVDETRRTNEPARQYVDRLARQKARACARGPASELVIAADQVCVNGDELLGKPGDIQSAQDQLRQASGCRVSFLSAVAVDDDRGLSTHSVVVSDDVVFRHLEDDAIQRYIHADEPLDCAGAFRAEGLGITLVEAVYSDDPTSLVGLPLITVARLLRQRGFVLP